MRAGLTLGSTPITDAASVWSALVLPDGAVLLGTGNEGKIFKVSGGQVTLVATTGEMAVSALALAWNGDVIAGTFPEGKLFKLPKGGGNGGPAPTFGTLEGASRTSGAWPRRQGKVLYAATGPSGKLFRATGRQGPGILRQRRAAPGLGAAVTTAPYAGLQRKAMLYKLTGPGAAPSLRLRTRRREGHRAQKGGGLYAIATSTPRPSPRRSATARGRQAIPPRPKSRQGRLMRFDKNGVAEKLLEDDDETHKSRWPRRRRRPYVGTGRGPRRHVSDKPGGPVVVDTDERQVGAVVMAASAA